MMSFAARKQPKQRTCTIALYWGPLNGFQFLNAGIGVQFPPDYITAVDIILSICVFYSKIRAALKYKDNNPDKSLSM